MRILLALGLISLLATLGAAQDAPRAVDDRLSIQLFANEPDIVTPTSIAVDDRGRVLAIECHTHFRPQNYVGPPADRIRLFEDTDGDGRADRISTFFEGSRWTMSLAIDRQGRLYVATRDEIFRLRDTDGDGQADERTPIVSLHSKATYPHNGLAGFAFDFAGNLYFGMGENLGEPYELVGSDGSTQRGSQGGHVFRCSADGGNLERFATGFWNPFHMAVDPFGRLFAVDNDPHSRPPCRLLHVVPGGNYGFKYSNGAQGLHPFTAWNGETPGSLPMVAGVGEAPCGVVFLPVRRPAGRLSRRPADHLVGRSSFGTSLVGTARRVVSGTAQSVHNGGRKFSASRHRGGPRRIAVRQRLGRQGIRGSRQGASLAHQVRRRKWHPKRSARFACPRHRPRAGNAKALFPSQLARKRTTRENRLRRGPKQPSPCCCDDRSRSRQSSRADRRGPAIENGSCRIGPICLVDRQRARTNLGRLAIAADQPPEVRAAALRWASGDHLAELWTASEDNDPFIAQAARLALGRLGAVSGACDVSQLPPRSGWRRFWCFATHHFHRATSHPATCWPRRSPMPIPKCGSRPCNGSAKTNCRSIAARCPRRYRQGQCRASCSRPIWQHWRISMRLKGPPGNRQTQLKRSVIPNNTWPKHWPMSMPRARPGAGRYGYCGRITRCSPSTFCARILDSDDVQLQREAIRTLAASPHAWRTAPLAEIARDTTRSPSLRAEATAGLPAEQSDLLLELAASDSPPVAHEALRCLVGATLDARQRASLRNIAHDDPQVQELIARVLDPQSAAGRPLADDVEAWIGLLAGPADADEGQRIFYSRAGGCSRCHTMEGRGGQIGPDLSLVGRALERRRLIESILRPSKEIAPQFVSWTVETKDGQQLSGLLVGASVDGVQTYVDVRGTKFSLPADAIERRSCAITLVNARRFGAIAHRAGISRSVGVPETGRSAGRDKTLTCQAAVPGRFEP